ncbi:MAG TPA: nuclear transport factor 2 family protein [Armatimonadota bacterium]|jgi:ketosteroid isomerase-like protein
MTDTQQTTASALLDAIARYDADAISSIVTDDALLLVPERPAYVGPEGAAEMIRDLSRTFVEWNPRALRVASEAGVSTVEWTCTITDFGGSESCLDGCTVLDFRDGKIQRARFYFRPEDRDQ